MLLRGNYTTAHERRKSSALRYISLPRLEREIARRQAAQSRSTRKCSRSPGLQRVRYVFVYPESGDLVLAGPAGDWRIDAEGRIVSTEPAKPSCGSMICSCLLRRGDDAADSHFGCSINPRQEALAKTQAFLASSSQRPLAAGAAQRAGSANLRDTVGLQDIEVFGIDPASRVASVLVEADYHMKLIGMGLADGVTASKVIWTRSNRSRPGESPPPMSVLRWWFALNYDSIAHVPGRATHLSWWARACAC